MSMNDEWSGLADLLAGVIEKYVCEMDLDEDEYERYICDHRSHCPYYRDGDEYRIAGKQ